MIILDTSGLLSAIDRSQRIHDAARMALEAAPPPWVLSPFVLAELDYLLATRVSQEAERALLAEVGRGVYRLEPFDGGDIEAAERLIGRYRELDIGLAGYYVFRRFRDLDSEFRLARAADPTGMIAYRRFSDRSGISHGAMLALSLLYHPFGPEGRLRAGLTVRTGANVSDSSSAVEERFLGFADPTPTEPNRIRFDRQPVETAQDGVSLWPVLSGEGVVAPHPPLYWEYHSQGGRQAVRDGRWKAVRLGASRAPDMPIQLYDLEVDPGEQHDVASAHPREAARLTQMLRELRTRSPIARFNFGAAAQP